MKIALLTDLHWGCRGGNVNFANMMFEFLEQQFYPHLVENDIKHVIVLGDFTDSRKATNYQIVDMVNKGFFDRLNKMGVEVHMLCGNHDLFYRNNNSVVSFNTVFRDKGDCFTYYNTPTEITIDGTPLFILPWINEQNYDECVEAMKSTSAKYCFAHLEIEGAKMYKHSVSERGTDKTIFKKFDKVFTGHYHHRNTYANVYYIGAAGFYNWQDYNDDRGFGVFDTDTGNIKYFNNNHCIFRRLKYDDTTGVDYDDVDLSACENKVVQLVVTNKTDDVMYDNFNKRLKKLKTIDYKVVDETIETAPESASEQDDIAMTATAYDIYESTVQAADDVDDDRKQVLSKLGKEIYDEALTII